MLRASSLFHRALVISALLLSAAAPPAAAKVPQRAAAPQANAAGVLAVFGIDGKEPKTYPDSGAVWKKRMPLQGHGDVEVTLAYSDIEIARTERRIFEASDPFRLPNGIYTYVILRDGTTSFGHPLDSWEIGTRHAHLAHGRTVVGSGELVKSNAAIKLNLLSGTFMIPMIRKRIVPNAAFLERRIRRWFDEVLRAKYKAPASFKVIFETKGQGTFENAVIFDNKLKPPTTDALWKLCSHAKFKGNNSALCQTKGN